MGGIYIEVIVRKLRVNQKNQNIVFIDQKEIGIENTVYPETQMNLYGDSKSLLTLAGLFNLVREKNVIVYLCRDTEGSSDFAFFHGTSNPLGFKGLAEIRNKIHKTNIVKSCYVQVSEETKADRMRETWRFKNLYSIRSSGQLISMSCNSLGLRLAELVCKDLSDSDQGHTHFDEWSTQGSVELIIRNKDTDMIFR